MNSIETDRCCGPKVMTVTCFNCLIFKRLGLLIGYVALPLFSVTIVFYSMFA